MCSRKYRHYHRKAEAWFERATVYAECYSGMLMTAPMAYLIYKQAWLLAFFIATFGCCSITFLLLMGALNSLLAHIWRRKWIKRRG